ncbi:amino acid ABC transporter substrate-binding protein [Uliginosibacterium sp. H3]|uniref:Amino acid ABC transporter substrate-binding protein n=1 Tax=Uliginosibacterium silvisoli TaxID=3114758 RepID=A0ABU6K5I1_9RHOO|nr:amino acid ABC transporter substrate-binding protein [Uliginosibacterium sp. H3]
MLRFAVIATTLLFAAGATQAQALDGRLKKIAADKVITIAYRTDAVPFAFSAPDKSPDGYSVDICKRVVGSIQQQLKLSALNIKWVPVTTDNRFDTVANGGADMECGASSVTQSRLKVVDFSNYIFVETTGLLIKRTTNLKNLSDLAGKKVVVIAGTSNERAVNELMKRRQIAATVLPVKTRDEAFALFDADKADAFASDKLLLLGAANKAKDPGSLVLLGDELSLEPYAIVLPRGDTSLRLAVNTGLAQLYRSEEIISLYKNWFATIGPMDPLNQVSYVLGAIPE